MPSNHAIETDAFSAFATAVRAESRRSSQTLGRGDPAPLALINAAGEEAMRMFGFLWLHCTSALLIFASLALAAQTGSDVRVLSSERFERYTSGGQTYSADKDSAILVLWVTGLTSQDLNRIHPREYFIKDGQTQYACLSVEILNTAAGVDEKTNKRRIFCRGPRTGKDLVLHVGDKMPSAFRVDGPIRAEGK